MKVVLFCGGLGLRMRGLAEGMPKPMAPLGNRPILWHLMKYYAHWGHKDFILCLGYKGSAIKEFFVGYKEWISNDFVLSEGGCSLEPLSRDIEDWRITFVDTGLDACVGERLLAVREHLRDEEVFLANYADGLTDCPLPAVVAELERGGATGAFITARANASVHCVEQDPDGVVRGVHRLDQMDLRINAGFFAFRQEIFDHMRPGEDLVEQPFARLIERRRLVALPWHGYWRCCDTFKDLQTLEAELARGPAPWEVWRRFPPGEGPEMPATARAARRPMQIVAGD